MCVCYYLTGANHYFFGCKSFRQSNINEKLKKKKSFPLRSIPKVYAFADISPNILMPNFQIFTAAYNFDNKTL